MTENEKYLEMPWSIEDTIENLKIIKEHFIATVLKANLDGKGKQDAKEVEFDFNRAIQALEKVQQFEAIGTVEEFKVLKEKSVAKKPLLRLCGGCQSCCVDCDRYEDRCPTCNGGLYIESGKPHKHCPDCGQKLDWQ